MLDNIVDEVLCNPCHASFQSANTGLKSLCRHYIFWQFQEGCSCKDTEFGCCPDRKTPASGIDGEGCGCAASWYGCCPDGEAEAEGEDFEGKSRCMFFICWL